MTCAARGRGPARRCGRHDLCDRIEAWAPTSSGFPSIAGRCRRSTDAQRLIRAVIERRVDAVTFTAKPAVENFLRIAGAWACSTTSSEAFDCGDVRIFCVGPVCATGVDRGRAPRPVRSGPSPPRCDGPTGRAVLRHPGRRRPDGRHSRAGAGKVGADRRPSGGLADRPGACVARPRCSPARVQCCRSRNSSVGCGAGRRPTNTWSR